jgi:hypothetical protein
MTLQKGGGKLAGKVESSGRRRAVTRRAGFGVKGDMTGGELRVEEVPQVAMSAGAEITLDIVLPAAKLADGEFFGFGGWFCASGTLAVSVVGVPDGHLTITKFVCPDWNKIGALWQSDAAKTGAIEVKLRALAEAQVALWGFTAGVVRHDYLSGARQPLLRNMHLFAPEALFLDKLGKVAERTSGKLQEDGSCRLYLKSCNRCQRYLPINVYNERNHLSFSNHCVASHRRPCSHGTFGRLTNTESGETLRLEYGYQLECRFCKKFEVNAAHNPQRTTAQMKEDAARRRALEVLVGALMGTTPQLRYREVTGRELSEDVLARFSGRCFRCNRHLKGTSWHLDHTRPLALLWPLDETATALCGSCNSEKRDRTPGEFYTEPELRRLSELAGLSLHELKNPGANPDVARALLGRLDWFFEEFLVSPAMSEVQDGKTAAELVVKAVQKALSRLNEGPAIDLRREWDKHRRQAGRKTKT